MCGIHHHLVWPGRTGQDADDVLGRLAPDRVGPGYRCLHAQRHCPEALDRGCHRKRGEILTRAGEQGLGDRLLNPANGLALVQMIAGRILFQLRPGPARLHHAPAIRRRFGIMHDDRRRRAVPRCFLELIGPAPVIGHRATTEWPVQGHRAPVRIVDQNDHRLALHIDTGIIVPAAFRRVDAVADEYDVAVLDRNAGCDAIGRDDQILAIRSRHRCLAAGKRQRRHVGGVDFHQRHVLEPAALIARLEARLLEALDDIGRGFVLGRRGRLAAFIGIGRQGLRNGLQRLDRDLRRLFLGDRGNGGGGQQQHGKGFAHGNSGVSRRRGCDSASRCAQGRRGYCANPQPD